MKLTGELLAAGKLMRPLQWPILSAQLLVGMTLALGSTWPGPVRWVPLAGSWLCWVVLLNGGTLAFNSAYDRDTQPVAYLADPPPPPGWLALAAFLLMLMGALLGGLLVSPVFGTVILGCTGLSWLYSHPLTRWKSRPGLDLAVNVLGYGCGTTAAGILAGLAALPTAPPFTPALVWFTAGFGLLFGSLYPLTQIYQHAEDTHRGDRTLTTAVGVPRSLEVALGLGLAAALAMLWGLRLADRTGLVLAALIPLVLWLGNLAWLRSTWAPRGPRNWEKAMYRGLTLWALVDAGLVLAWLAPR